MLIFLIEFRSWRALNFERNATDSIFRINQKSANFSWSGDRNFWNLVIELPVSNHPFRSTVKERWIMGWTILSRQCRRLIIQTKKARLWSWWVLVLANHKFKADSFQNHDHKGSEGFLDSPSVRKIVRLLIPQLPWQESKITNGAIVHTVSWCGLVVLKLFQESRAALDTSSLRCTTDRF